MSWGLEGMLDVFVRKLGVGAVVYESVVLVLFGLVSLGVAGLFYKKSV
jgi:hypothetical protein